MRGDFPGSIALYRQALDVAGGLPTRNDAELQTIYGNLALVYQQMGDYVSAGAAFNQAADIAARTSGPDFVTYWDIGANAARTLHLAGERERADAQFESLMTHLPPPSQHVIGASTARENYGERLAAEGRPALGVPLLEIAERDLIEHPRDDFDVRLVRWRLGDALARAGRTSEARVMLSKAIDDYIAHSKPDQQPLLGMRERWGRFLLDQGELAAAVSQFDEIVRQAHDRKLTHIALAHGDLARAALASRKVDVALQESAVALDLWEHRQGYYDVRMGPYLQRIRADALAASGERAEAQRLEDAAWAASEKFDAPESPTRKHRQFGPPG
jgi:serine/threonine-protein kinase